MKILHVINDLKMGGAETMLVDLCRFMVEWGHDLEVLTLGAASGPIPAMLRETGARLSTTGHASAYHPRNVARLRSALCSRAFEIAHIHLFPAQLWTAVALTGTASATPTVTTEHNTWNRRREYPIAWLDRWMYSKFSRTIAISAAVKNSLVRWTRSGEDTVEVIPNGIDLRKFLRPAFPVALPGSKRYKALCVASLTERKNHACLFEALAGVPDLDLVLVGTGEQMEPLAQLADRLSIADRVHFLGTRTDVPELLAAADIYVQPSRWEGFGLAALEALAAGRPVLASAVPGLAEVVGDGGLLISQDSPDAWRDGLDAVLAQPELRERLQGRARLQAERFRVESTVEQYLEVYRRTITRQHVRPATFSLTPSCSEPKEPTA